MKLKNVIIKLNVNTTEEIEASVVNTLYRNKDIIQEAEGHLHTNAAKVDKIDALKDKFPNLIIDADKEIIIDAADSENEVALMEVMNTLGWVLNPTYMLKSEAESIFDFGETLQLSNITDFSCGKYFTGVNTITITKSLAYPLFYGNVNLTTVDLRNIVKIIDNTGNDTSLFYNCYSLESINLDNLEEYFCKTGRINYKENLFGNCISLRTIKLPKLKWLLGDMFKGCTSLRLTDFDESFPSVTSIHSGCWSGYSRFNPNEEYDSLYGVEVFGGTKCNFINLPERILYIDRNQYWISDTTGTQTHPLYNSKYMVWGGYKTAEDALTSVNIDNDNLSTSNGVITLKKNLAVCTKAFYENTTLKGISGMSRIGNQAFYGCTGLTGEIDLNGATIEGNEIFKNCSNITNVKNGTVISNETSKLTGLFDSCTGLTRITDDIWNLFSNTLPNTTFRYCTGITDDIVIPEKITTIGNTLFENIKVNSVELKGVPQQINRAFYGCLCKKLILPEGLNELRAADNLLIFQNMQRLININLNNIETIYSGSNLFNSDYCLKFIEFNKLNYIRINCWNNNFGLKVVYLNQNTVPTCELDITISNNTPLLKFYVPTGMKSRYTADSKWNAVADRIVEVSFTEIEDIKKEYYGVDFFGDKYYDTKRLITRNTSIQVEIETWSNSGRLFGTYGNNNCGYSWFNTSTTAGLNLESLGTSNEVRLSHTRTNLVKQKFTTTISSIADDTETKTATGSVTKIPDVNLYIGGRNYKNTALNLFTGTIYKFLWYESDTLVQAWIGNENGGFDIYANEDIVLQENDRKFSLSEYAG